MGLAERRERQKQEIRSKILEAARELFVTRGFEAVSMRQIAEKIEYSPTAIYFHFQDKEALLRELCATDFLAFAGVFQKAAAIPDPIERLRRLGEAYITFGMERPNHYRLMFMTPHPPVHPEKYALEKGNPEQDAYALLRATVIEAIAAQRFLPELKDPELVSQSVWAGVHGVISLHIAKCNDAWVDWRAPQKTARLVTDSLLKGMMRNPAELADG